MRLVQVNDMFTVGAHWGGTHAPRVITAVHRFMCEYIVPISGEHYEELHLDDLKRYLETGEWMGPYNVRIMLPDGV